MPSFICGSQEKKPPSQKYFPFIWWQLSQKTQLTIENFSRMFICSRKMNNETFSCQDNLVFYINRNMERHFWLVPGNVKNNRINQLHEKRSIDTVRIKSPDMKKKFLFQSFAAFRASLMQGEASDWHLYAVCDLCTTKITVCPGPYLGFFVCGGKLRLRGQTPQTFTGISRIQTGSNTMLEKKISFPGGGNCPPPCPPAMYGPEIVGQEEMISRFIFGWRRVDTCRYD